MVFRTLVSLYNQTITEAEHLVVAHLMLGLQDGFGHTFLRFGLPSVTVYDIGDIGARIYSL